MAHRRGALASMVWQLRKVSFHRLEGRAARAGSGSGPRLRMADLWRARAQHRAGVRAVSRTRMGRALDRALRLPRMDAGAGWRGMPRSDRGDAERIGANDRAMVPAPDAPARPSGVARRSAPRGGVGRPAMSRRLTANCGKERHWRGRRVLSYKS